MSTIRYFWVSVKREPEGWGMTDGGWWMADGGWQNVHDKMRMEKCG